MVSRHRSRKVRYSMRCRRLAVKMKVQAMTIEKTNQWTIKTAAWRREKEWSHSSKPQATKISPQVQVNSTNTFVRVWNHSCATRSAMNRHRPNRERTMPILSIPAKSGGTRARYQPPLTAHMTRAAKHTGMACKWGFRCEDISFVLTTAIPVLLIWNQDKPLASVPQSGKS